jgi:hypothetical protein
MLSIPNSLNSTGRFVDARSRTTTRPYAPLAGSFGQQFHMAGAGGSSGGMQMGLPTRRMPLRRPQLGPVMAAGGGLPPFGGGGGSASMGGGTPSFGGIGRQSPFSSDRDGSTVAPLSSATSGGLRDFYQDQSNLQADTFQPVVQGQSFASTKPAAPARLSAEELGRAAYGTGPNSKLGGPIPLGQPFIAGDAQKDGKPNEELILPTPEGIHVIPMRDLKGLQKFGDGTVRKGSGSPGNVKGPMCGKGLKPPTGGLEKFYSDNPNTPNAAQMEHYKLLTNPKLKMPIRIPALPKLAYGTVKNMGDRLEAFDDTGKMVGWSVGAMPPQNEPYPGNPEDMPPAPSALKLMRNIETADAQAARQQAMNPDGIDVGFTPRPALTGFARPVMLPEQREDAQYARMQRQIMREGIRNPAIGAQLLDSRARGMQAQQDRQQRIRTAQETQRATTERTELTQKGANERAEASRKAAEDARIVAWQQALLKQNTEEALKQLEEQRKKAAALENHPSINPYTGQPDLDHYKTGNGMVIGTGRPKGMLPTAPNSGEYYNADQPSLGNFKMMPQQTMPTFPGATVVPPQFKQVTKPEPVKPPPVKNFGEAGMPNWRQFDESTGKWLPVQFADRNQNGVPDNMEGGAGAAGGGAATAISSFVNRVRGGQ